ncbi:MAG: undecaprenyl-diphosphate phosphatase [Ruminococcaceae bacterium]|nr:undecaprenyl-diphosphate phosphatase [Oscillospiraceae bacterium]
MIEYIKSIVYGIIQGLTEFLPVSSSGHLAVFQNIFGSVGVPEVTFTLLLHVGTLAAVLLVYYKDVWELIKSFFSVVGKIFTGKFKFKNLNDGEKFFCLLFIALIPLVIGALLENAVEFLSGYTFAVGILWLINGVVFILSENAAVKQKQLDEIKPSDAFKVGFFQLFAILPGISRSGMTITGGVLHGFKREFAVKFSFILSIPAILGSTLITLLKDWEAINFGDSTGIILAGVAASFISGLAAIKLLQYITNKHNFKVFAYYCFAAGVIAIGYDVVTRFII